MNYEPIIGMEIHVELATAAKMFCGCPADHFQKPANSQVCPVCLGLPGALPVPNGAAIRSAQLIGLALGCRITEFSKFDRKNYFYPDLPKGYQISQYDLPFCKNGRLRLDSGKTIGVRRVHLEEDTAKLFHTATTTLIDFNRSGVPLAEVVTEPDLRSAGESKLFLKKLVEIIRHLGVSSCDMEKGTLRLEANISLRCVGDKELPPYKVEVKNVNSFRYIESAIDYEIKRHKEILDNGSIPPQETRGFDENKGITVEQRSKEEAHDYRYFPEPDIPPLQFTAQYIKKLKASLPDLPDVTTVRLKTSFGLNDHYASTLTKNTELLAKFNQLVKLGMPLGVTPEKIANALVNKRLDLNLTPEAFIKSLTEKATTIGAGKLQSLVKEVLKENPQVVSDYKNGKSAALGYLVGAMMKKNLGKVNPVNVVDALKKELR
jgi:aspartyl-tRNA(Asn)/glutamyl-tRNA(Gln) amidotransferase subunit B